MPDFDINKDSYNAIANQWCASRMAFYGREQVYLATFLDGLPKPAHILDLGCGSGRPMAAHVLDQGHRITGVDQADKLLDVAREHFPHSTWIESGIENFVQQASTSEQRYAGIVCWDTLFHIERSTHKKLLQGMADMLEEGGRLMLTCGGSEHAAFTDTMHGATFFYDSHTPEKMLEMLNHFGFNILLAEFMNIPTKGRDKGRYAIVACKRPPLSSRMPRKEANEQRA